MDSVQTKVDPKHYNKHKIQPINFILALGLGFCEGNIIKYICRYKDKGGKEDLLKARKYIDFLIDGGIKWVTDTSIGKTVKKAR